MEFPVGGFNAVALMLCAEMQHNIVCELNNYISLVGELCVIAHDKSTTRIFKAMTTKPCLNNNQIDSSWE